MESKKSTEPEGESTGVRPARSLGDSNREGCVCMHKQLPKYIVTLILVLWAVLLPASAAPAAKPDLAITGTGLHKDVEIYPGDWGKYEDKTRYYSSNNNFDYHKIWKVRGYDIFEMIGLGNLKTDKDYKVIFISALDGARVTKTVKELRSQYYYPTFTTASGEGVAPMLSFYRTAVFEPDYQGRPEPNEVKRDDRNPTVDHDAPRLIMGQARGDVDDNNQSFFNKKVGRIVVGEERPKGEKQVKTEKGKSSGSATAGKGGAGETDSGKAGTRDDPAGEAAAEKGGKEGEPGDHKDETAPGREAEEEITAGPRSGDSPDLEEAAKEQPRRARRPWAAAGAAAVIGSAGGGIYYYISRRRA